MSRFGIDRLVGLYTLVVVASLFLVTSAQAQFEGLLVDEIESEPVFDLFAAPLPDVSTGILPPIKIDLLPPCVCTVMGSLLPASLKGAKILNPKHDVVNFDGTPDVMYKLKNSSGCENAGAGRGCNLIRCTGDLEFPKPSGNGGSTGSPDTKYYGTCRRF